MMSATELLNRWESGDLDSRRFCRLVPEVWGADWNAVNLIGFDNWRRLFAAAGTPRPTETVTSFRGVRGHDGIVCGHSWNIGPTAQLAAEHYATLGETYGYVVRAEIPAGLCVATFRNRGVITPELVIDGEALEDRHDVALDLVSEHVNGRLSDGTRNPLRRLRLWAQ